MFPSSPTSANLNDSSHKRSIDDLYGDLDIQEAYTPTFTTDDVANLVNKAKDIFTDFGSLFERTKKKHVTELAHVRMEREFGFEYLKQEKEKTEKVLERIIKEKDELELKNNTVNEEFIQKMDDVEQELHQERLEKQSIAFENGEVKNELEKIKQEFEELSNEYVVLSEQKKELEAKLGSIENIVSGHMYEWMCLCVIENWHN